jgi:hypothetical protein
MQICIWENVLICRSVINLFGLRELIHVTVTAVYFLAPLVNNKLAFERVKKNGTYLQSYTSFGLEIFRSTLQFTKEREKEEY